MQNADIYTLFLIIAVSLLVAIPASIYLIRIQTKQRTSIYDLMIESQSETAYLFSDNTLIDATPDARQRLRPAQKNVTDLQRLIATFSDQFSSLNNDLLALGGEGSLTILPDNPDENIQIQAEWWNGLSRIIVVDTAKKDFPIIDTNKINALEDELEILRQTAKLSPYLVWLEDRVGKIIWANAAYISLAEDLSFKNKKGGWPPPKLFTLPRQANSSPNPETIRVSLKSQRLDALIWFELSCKKINESMLCFAVPADEAVQAEASLKGFIQTLTKTFAHLSVGLAIFDRNRKLVLFNPALTDLIRLPVEFLSLRPTLFAFLDRLREDQMMPEPKNYKDWREKIAAIEKDAIDGTYEETWDLPGAQTYRITARVHGDGAIALLFEDITAEISLTRNFRSELEIGQSVLDTLEDAVVVFAASGSILLSNTAYTQLWGVDPSSTFGEMDVNDAIRSWKQVCDPTDLWARLLNFIGGSGGREEWYGDAVLDDGRPLACRFSPLSGGTTLVQFRILPAISKRGKKTTSIHKSSAGL